MIVVINKCHPTRGLPIDDDLQITPTVVTRSDSLPGEEEIVVLSGTVPASGPLLVNDELVRPTEEDLRGQVPSQFAAQGALDGDGLKWKLIPARLHIAAASVAGDHEGFAA
jgi:hypothetical protein